MKQISVVEGAVEGEKHTNVHVWESRSVSDDSRDVAAMLNSEYIEYIDALQNTNHDYEYDPNSSMDLLSQVQIMQADPSKVSDDEQWSLIERLRMARSLLLQDSPYPEVRSVVDPVDDPSLPVSTIRVWFLGTIFTILGTGINEFFANRYPGIFITSSVAQLLSYPCGIAMARFLPSYCVSSRWFSFELNPGPFNQKEHMLITIMSNVAYGGTYGTPYVTSIFTVLKLDIFFGEKSLSNSIGFKILLALSTQLMGYGCAGLLRRILVYPQAAIWPNALAQIALNKALHNDNGKSRFSAMKLSRRRFFTFCFVGMFVYFWLPDYLFQAMSFFNWMTWISPNNKILAIMTGSLCGLGLNPLPTFDWNVATYLIDPIKTPFFSTLNITIGMVVSGLLVVLPLYWNNVFNTAYFPITSNHVYDDTKSPFNVSKILNSENTLDLAKYESYSRLYISAGFCVTYASFFAVYTAVVVHALLYNWRQLKMSVMVSIRNKKAGRDHTDVHNRLMRVYKEVPHWWYGVVLAISFLFACIACGHYPTGMPIWGIVIALIVCLVLQIPTGIIAAVTNIQIPDNVIAEYVAGHLIPNKPIPNMIFKAYGTMVTAQSVGFSMDLKLGHYMKIAPRIMFTAQVYATVWSCFVSIAVNSWQLTHIKDLCQRGQANGFTCPGNHSFFSSAVIWGAIGPKRMFGTSGFYHQLGWGFLIGLCFPIICWFLTRKYPRSFWRYVQAPLLIWGAASWAPWNLSFVWPATVIGFIFNFYIKRQHLEWWQKYAYIMTTAFAAAIAISAIVIFWAVQYHDRSITWWGNTVSFSGVDGGAETAPLCVLKTLPDGATIPK